MFNKTGAAERRREQERQRNIAIAAGGAVLLGIIFAVYSWGTSRQNKITQKQATEYRQRGDYLRQQLKQCQNKTRLRADQAALLEGDAARLWASNRQLQDENDRLLAVNNDAQNSVVRCQENFKLTKDSWEHEDSTLSGQVWKLSAVNAKLQQEILRLSNGSYGMRSTVLNSLLDELIKEHQTLRWEYDGIRPTVDRKYVDALVASWQKTDEEMVQAGKPGPMSSRDHEILPINASEKRDIHATVLTRFDPDRHAKMIFIPTRSADGKWQLPGWNGRQGTQQLRMGTYINRKLCPVTNINRQMRVLYEYALCALALNVTHFMYPSRFKRCATCKDDWLHNYIETPLVLFCDDCRPQHTTNAFKLLCAGNAAENQYGGELFWRMRSRLLFKGVFRTKAEDWMQENFFRAAGMDPADRGTRWGKTLAVRLSNFGNPEWAAKCETVRQTKRPVMAYEKILKGREGVVEHSQDVDEQCSPPQSVVVSTINAKVKQMSADGDTVRVYISAGRNITEAQWFQLEGAIEAPAYRRRNTERATEDDIVDTLISASCDGLILNRYDIKSTQMLEAHMLYSDLSVKDVSVW